MIPQGDGSVVLDGPGSVDVGVGDEAWGPGRGEMVSVARRQEKLSRLSGIWRRGWCVGAFSEGGCGGSRS